MFIMKKLPYLLHLQGYRHLGIMQMNEFVTRNVKTTYTKKVYGSEIILPI